MLSSDDLRKAVNELNNGGNLKKEEKQKLAGCEKKMCEGQEEQSSEEAVDAFREKQKTEAKNEVKAELLSEIQEKANKLEQIEKEKADLQTKFDAAEKEKADLQTKFDAAEKEKTELQQQLDNLTKDATAIEDLFADGSIKTEIEGLIGFKDQELEGKIKDLYDGKLRSELKEIFYEEFQRGIIEFMKNGKSTGEIEDLQQQLKAKDDEINKLNDQIQQLQAAPNDTAAQLKAKDEKIKDLEAKISQPNAEVEKLKTDLQAQNARVQQLTQKNKELEAKNKTTEQPKQSNGARYTATAGVGLAAGLVAFTALERTVKLEMLVMIGIAVASALVAGGITYKALPSTQVDGAKAQEVSGNKKSK